MPTKVVRDNPETLKPEMPPIEADFTPSWTWIVFALFVAILLSFAIGGLLQYDSQPIHGVPLRT